MREGFVAAHKDEHGVEPILTTLADTPVGIAPSTYYAAKSRPASSRALADAGLVPVIAKVHAENYGCTGRARCGTSCAAKGTMTWPAAPWSA